MPDTYTYLSDCLKRNQSNLQIFMDKMFLSPLLSSFLLLLLLLSPMEQKKKKRETWKLWKSAAQTNENDCVSSKFIGTIVCEEGIVEHAATISRAPNPNMFCDLMDWALAMVNIECVSTKYYKWEDFTFQ